MIRYPLYVTIDTNIFDSTGYDLRDDGTLGHLCSYVQSGKIKIVLKAIKVMLIPNNVQNTETLMQICTDTLVRNLRLWRVQELVSR